MPDLSELIKRGHVLLDGAWGTQLQALGLKTGASPESWNMEFPDKVRRVAACYVEAGSEIILTNTFGGSRIMLDRHDMGGRASEINRIGAEISKDAAGDRALVFGSIGPSGKMLLMDEITAAELEDAFSEQALGLAMGGADGIVIETIGDLAEAQCAVRAASETGLPVVCCMVFDHGPDKDRTMMGHTPEDAVAALVDSGIVAMGANCGAGIDAYIDVCRRYQAATDLPLWIKPNAGLPEWLDGKVHYASTPDEFSTKVKLVLDAGATFVGGCCGTTPAFINRVAEDHGSVRNA